MNPQSCKYKLDPPYLAMYLDRYCDDIQDVQQPHVKRSHESILTMLNKV
jgi:hypothetical protein